MNACRLRVVMVIALCLSDGHGRGHGHDVDQQQVQCLNVGNDVSKLKHYHVMLLVRGGESVSNLAVHLDILQEAILPLECPCTYDNPCGDDCEHCLRVEGKPHCIKMVWASD